MKYFVVTDVHGSYDFALKAVRKFEEERADKLVILGDFYYHGPRNPLPEGYAPLKVAQLLNEYKNDIIAIRGNCDADIDQTISEFIIKKSATVRVGGRKIFFTHGDKYNKDNISTPLHKGDVMLFGHWHINELSKVNGVIAVNLASVSLPKNGCKPSYAIVDNSGVTVRTLDGEIVFTYSFD